MKEITRRNFLRVITSAVLIGGMGMLSSCGKSKKSKEELMCGDWYIQGYDTLAFSFYDDGTCQVRARGDYVQGTWSVVDEDTLKLDYYGEIKTCSIATVDNNSLELELSDGETIMYYHTAEEALKH